MVKWDSSTLGIDGEETRKQLSEGEPRIEVFTHECGIEVMPYMMETGEAEIVAKRLAEIFRAA
jgi:hypothetical protein